MSQREASKRMKQFANKYKGKSVLFAGLSDQEKYDYVLIKTFSYFSKRFPKEALKRAIGNADAHKSEGFNVFNNRIDEHMVIS